jgi:ribonuclease D
MLPLPSTDPLWIATPQALQKITAAIATEPLLAIDTESNSLFAYRERVCLVQVSTPSTDYLIDTLALDDLSSLAMVFANPQQQKIFHAAEYDVICLKRDYGFTFGNLFDTMIAARILAELQVGLGSLLSTYFGIELDKKYQRANWGRRPLPAAMLDYARMDTHYLFVLKSMLEEKLKTQGLWELALEDFALVCKASQSTSETNGNSCWKVAGNNRLNSRETALLHAVCAYRDRQAQKLDLPHFKVLSNQLLVELSRAAPHTMQELMSVPGMAASLAKRHGSGLLRAIEEGEQAQPLTRPSHKRPEKATMDRLKVLHEWRKELAKELKVESDVVLPREFMERIAGSNPGSMAELKQLMAEIPWRYRNFGKAILKRMKKSGGK